MGREKLSQFCDNVYFLRKMPLILFYFLCLKHVN